MNRIVKTFISAQRVAKEREWNRIYIGCDIHSTTLKPTYSTELSREYYPFAKETLKMLSERTDICLILWSCSLPEINKEYFDFFKQDGINFDYINENPECSSTEYADFDTKLYFSVGLDDKFGFDPDKDWEALKEYLFLLGKEDSIYRIDRSEFEGYDTLTQSEEYEKLKSILDKVEYTSVPSFGNNFYSKIDINDEDVRILKVDVEDNNTGYLVGFLNWPKKSKFYFCATFDDVLLLLKMKNII
jgi:hypothetical protein